MLEELDSLQEHGTWEYTDLPKGRKAIGSKWVFEKEIGGDKSIQRYKARFVAKDFSQIKGIDFNETFAPVARLATICILVALAIVCGWSIEQMNGIAAYLHNKLEEQNIYMTLPEDLVVSIAQKNKVLHLFQTLYGLKQSSRGWNKNLDCSLVALAWKHLKSDSYLFIMKIEGSHCLY